MEDKMKEAEVTKRDKRWMAERQYRLSEASGGDIPSMVIPIRFTATGGTKAEARGNAVSQSEAALKTLIADRQIHGEWASEPILLYRVE